MISQIYYKNYKKELTFQNHTMEANSKMSNQFIIEDSWLYIPNGTENTKNLSKNTNHLVKCVKEVVDAKMEKPLQTMWITDNHEYAFCKLDKKKKGGVYPKSTLQQYCQKRHICIKEFGEIITIRTNWIQLSSNYSLTKEEGYSNAIGEDKEELSISFPPEKTSRDQCDFVELKKISLKDLIPNESNQGLFFGYICWHDQGWGNQKGEFLAELRKENNSVFPIFQLGVAGHEVRIDHFCINLNELTKHDLNINDEIVFRYKVGCGSHCMKIIDTKLYESKLLSGIWARNFQTIPIEDVVKHSAQTINSKENFEKRYTMSLQEFDMKKELSDQKDKTDSGWYTYDSADVTQIEKLRLKGKFSWNNHGKGNMEGQIKILYAVDGKADKVQYDAGIVPQYETKQEFFIVFDKPADIGQDDKCLLKVMYKVGPCKFENLPHVWCDLCQRFSVMNIKGFEITNFSE